MDEEMEIEESMWECPNCGTEIIYPCQTSCNECECCFCSEKCREEWHKKENVVHDYNKPILDLI